MNRILGHRFGLTSFVFVSSLLTSTFSFGDQIADKQNAQPNPGPQQVVVTNTAAQPVPVSTPSKDYFQSSIDFSGCSGQNFVSADFTVPAGKKLALQYINVEVNSISPGQTFSIVVQANQESTKFWLPMSQIGGFSNNQFVWAGHHALLLVTDKVHAVMFTSQQAVCIGSFTISGELVPAQ